MSVRSYNRPPFQLLEVTLISAQDLAPASKSMHTYAVAWVNPSRRLATRVDQHGHTQPSWNDKFVFRVDDDFLSSATSAVNVEVFAVSWLRRDVKLGGARVLISSLVPPGTPDSSGNTRFVALQVRRPSGRPQGILNVGVAILDSAMRSMPLYTELSASAVGYRDLIDGRRQKHADIHARKTLRRTQSERTTTTADRKQKPPSSLFVGSIYEGSAANGSDIGLPVNKAGGRNGSVCSDLGPSPSVVAAAVARGFHRPADDDAGSSVVGDWTEETSSVEGLRSKLERWRTEMPPIYDGDHRKIKLNANRDDGNKNNRNARRRRHTDGGGGLFSCFANAYGCEFSITCGGPKRTKSKKYGKVPVSPSEDNMSRSYI